MEIVKNEQPTELLKRIPVDETPFLVIWDDVNKKAFGTFGKYKITEEKDNVEKVIEELQKVTWDKLITIIALVYDMMKSEFIAKTEKP